MGVVSEIIHFSLAEFLLIFNSERFFRTIMCLQHVLKIMCISGTYYVLKKSLALHIPLDETRIWGQGEDVLFCKLVIGAGIQIKCNPHSTVQFRKGKVPASWEHVMTKADIETLESLSEETLETLNKRQRALV